MVEPRQPEVALEQIINNTETTELMTTINCTETTFNDCSNNLNPYLGTGKVVSGMYLDNKLSVTRSHMTKPDTHLDNKHSITHVDEPVISDRLTPNEVVTPSFCTIRSDELAQRKRQLYMYDGKGRSQQNNQRSSYYGSMTNNCDKTNMRQKAQLNTIVVLEDENTGCSGNDEHVRMSGRGIKALTVTENTHMGTQPTSGEPGNCHNAENPCVVGEATSTNINYPEGLNNNATGTDRDVIQQGLLEKLIATRHLETRRNQEENFAHTQKL